MNKVQKIEAITARKIFEGELLIDPNYTAVL